MKLTLTVQSGTLMGNRLDLTEGIITVGRGAGCNLLFDPMQENMVSTKHAHIETKPDGFYLFDDRSTNGTFVNGSHVQITKLNSGDTIQFGKNGPEVKVFIEAEAVQPQSFNQFQPPASADAQTVAMGEQFQPPPSADAQTVAMGEQFQPPPPNLEKSFQPPPPNFGQSFQPPPPNFAQPFQPPQFVEPFPQEPANFRNSMSFIGLSNPAGKVEEKSNVGKIIGAVIAVAIYAVLGLLSMLIIASEVGFVTAAMATVIAFIPPLIYILPLIFLDRYDPEPPWLIAAAFAWGGIVAVFFSIIVNTTVGLIAGGVSGSGLIQMLVGTVISAPIFEEFSKGLGVVILLIFFRREFDDILDGIVYGGVIGLGFATVENILYYGRAVNTGAIEGVLLLFFVRGVLSPFIHSSFTAMTGIGCGIARESHNWAIRIIAPIGGYILAVVLHMFWNGVLATLAPILYVVMFGGRPEDSIYGFLIAYAIFALPFFIIFIIFSGYIMRRQNRILRESLAIDVAQGLITDEQLKTATSAFKSTGWLFGGIPAGKFFARWKFLRSVGKLGLTYWHIQRANAAQGQTGSFQQNPILRAEVEKWRDKI